MRLVPFESVLYNVGTNHHIPVVSTYQLGGGPSLNRHVFHLSSGDATDPVARRADTKNVPSILAMTDG